MNLDESKSFKHRIATPVKIKPKDRKSRNQSLPKLPESTHLISYWSPASERVIPDLKEKVSSKKNLSSSLLWNVRLKTKAVENPLPLPEMESRKLGAFYFNYQQEEDRINHASLTRWIPKKKFSATKLHLVEAAKLLKSQLFRFN